jgi:hypothetical protein
MNKYNQMNKRFNQRSRLQPIDSTAKNITANAQNHSETSVAISSSSTVINQKRKTTEPTGDSKRVKITPPLKYCKTCKGTDHSRRSSKMCKRYKESIVEIHAPKDVGREVTRTTQIGLRNMLKYPLLLPVIESMVSKCSQISFEATRLLNLFVVLKIENHEPIPNLSTGRGGLMRRFFTGVCGASKTNIRICKASRMPEIVDAASIYSNLRKTDMPWTNPFRMSQLISLMVNAYEVNCANHLVSNLPTKLDRWLRYKLEKHVGGFVDNNGIRKLCKFIMDRLKSGQVDEDFTDFPRNVLEQVEEGYHDLLFGAVSYFLDKAFNRILNGMLLDVDAIRRSWWEYLVPFHSILKTFKKNCQSDAEERMISGTRGHGLRLFSLLPLSNFQRKFIDIDTTAFYDILKSAGPLAIGITEFPFTTVKQFRKDAMLWWNHVFRLNKATSEHRRFAFSILTDGVGCSVRIRRPEDKPPEVNDRGFDVNGVYCPLVVDENNVIGLDPGRRELFVAIGVDRKPIRCSNARWQEISGNTYAMKKKSTWMKANRRIRGLESNIPSPCSYTTLDVTEHIQYVLKFYQEFHEFYGQLRWRRLRWKTRIKKMKAYDILANQLTGRVASTVIAYGDGGFSHASRGSPATPNKHLIVELKKRCRVRLTPEFKTSQLCSLCDERLSNTHFYSIKECKNTCFMLWNRDVNAARNIRRVFLYLNRNGGERPPPFRRQQIFEEVVDDGGGGGGDGDDYEQQLLMEMEMEMD